jgi:alpha-beta hydrolase superfamily lysophospholipase
MKAKSLAKFGLGTATVLLVVVAAAGLLLSSGKTLGERHVAFADAPRFDFANGSFEEYVVFAKAAIAREREDNPPQTVIDNLGPFVLTPGPQCPQDAQGRYQKGIVLTHGLLDSTYNMRPIGEFFQSQCFYVLAMLLPGHGTRPGDLLTARWQEWADATHFAATQLALHANTLFLAGHSIGGTLSVLEAARNPDIDALVLFAPAIAITDTARFARYISVLGKIFPKAGWLGTDPDEAVYRYESMSFSSVAETWKVINTTREAVTQQTRQLPTFTVASMQDTTVSIPAILDYMANNTSPLSRTILYSRNENEDGGLELDRIPNLTTISSYMPDQKILSLSHLGLMTPPSHPWFGRDAVYRNCSHYGEEDARYAQCKNGARDFYAETTPENTQAGVVERIMFNPFYDQMLEQIRSFAAAIN